MAGASENAPQAIDAEADAGKHGGFCVSNAQTATEAAALAAGQPPVSGTRWFIAVRSSDRGAGGPASCDLFGIFATANDRLFSGIIHE
jgi:hypothetical protein